MYFFPFTPDELGRQRASILANFLYIHVCMYVCVYVCVCVCVCVHTHTHISTYKYAHINIYNEM